MATKQAAGDTAREDIGDQIEAIRSDIAQLADSISRLAGAEIGAARDRLRDTASSLRDRSEELADSARDSAQVQARRVEDAVHENPMGAVLVAIGLGFLVGIFTRR